PAPWALIHSAGTPPASTGVAVHSAMSGRANFSIRARRSARGVSGPCFGAFCSRSRTRALASLGMDDLPMRRRAAAPCDQALAERRGVAQEMLVHLGAAREQLQREL